MIKIAWDESTNQDLLKGTLEELFDSTDKEKLVEYPQIFREMSVDEYYFRNMRIAGLPHGGEVADGANIPTYDPVYGQVKELAQKRYGWGFTITRMMKKFWAERNYGGIVEKFTRNLKVVMYEMKDIEVFKLINAPTSTTWTGYDGLALASDSHTCLDDAATQYDNLTTSDLSVSSYEDAYVYFDTIVDDQAKIKPGRPNKLMVPPQMRVAAQQIMGSQLVPFEQSNTKNIFPDWDITLFVAHRMTDTDGWAMADTNHEDYGLVVATSQEPDIQVQDSPNTARNTYVTSEQMFNYRFFDPRYYYNATPA